MEIPKFLPSCTLPVFKYLTGFRASLYSAAAAVQVAAEAQCKAVVLTHFSQRYPKVGKLADVCEGRAAVAFDMLTIDSQRLQRNSALLVNVLNKFFSEDADEELQRPAATAVAEGAPHAVGEPAVEPQAAYA